MRETRAAAGVLTVLLMAVGACGDPKPERTGAPPTSASRPVSDGLTPETNAIVAREGDHLVVIVDVAAIDRQGHRVEKAALEADSPSTSVKASPVVATDSGLTVEARVPAATRALKLVGSSEGGATWSKLIATDLDAR